MTLQPAAELLGAHGVDEVGPDAASANAPPHPPAITTHSPCGPTDELLLARFLKGDRDALGTLATRHESQLLGLACALTGRRDLALEAVQETWLKVIKYGRSFKSGSTVKTWLYRILINNSKDVRKKSRGGTGSSLPVRLSTDAPDNQQQHFSDPPDPPDLAHLRTAVDNLSGDQKLLILLCYHNGLTHPQAAEVLNIPLGTLKSRLNTILTTLRTRLMPHA